MITFANAKINLGLDIVRKRADGYHDISTIFYPIPLADAVEIVKTDGETGFESYGIEIDCPPEKNLVMKTYEMFRAEFNLPNSLIGLMKKVPFGAGLGGGSSDAAAVAKIVNTMYNLRLSDEELAARVVKIGADCPFFIYNRPMIASGIGDILNPVDLSLKGYKIVLVKPDVHVSTAEAYSGVTPREPAEPLEKLIQRPISEWRGLVKNDFEDSVFAAHPELADIKQAFYDNGAVYASMSGSGSAIYGIFDNDRLAEKYAESIDAYLLETFF